MVTIGTGAAAAALAGAATLGAVGLTGLGIAALAGRRRGGRRGGRRGRGRGGRFRGRREATNGGDMKDTDKKEAAPEKKEVSATKKEQLATDEERILSAIREADEDLCGFRLVCELSGKPYEMVTEEEMEILRFVHEGDEAVGQGKGVLPTDPILQEYQSAARLGATGYDCASIYQTCQLSAAELMASFRALIL